MYILYNKSLVLEIWGSKLWKKKHLFKKGGTVHKCDFFHMISPQLWKAIVTALVSVEELDSVKNASYRSAPLRSGNEG